MTFTATLASSLASLTLLSVSSLCRGDLKKSGSVPPSWLPGYEGADHFFLLSWFVSAMALELEKELRPIARETGCLHGRRTNVFNLCQGAGGEIRRRRRTRSDRSAHLLISHDPLS